MSLSNTLFSLNTKHRTVIKPPAYHISGWLVFREHRKGSDFCLEEGSKEGLQEVAFELSLRRI